MHDELYLSLLQKQLSGKLTPEEQSRLDDWLAASPDHRHTARSIRKAWELSEGFAQDVDLDLDADFEKLERRIAASKGDGAKVVPFFTRRRILSIAAAIVLLLAGPFLIKKYLQPAVRYESFSTGESPSKEPLALADGSKVWLNGQSSLSYFTASAGKERRVKLQGEAFFEVAKDAEKPFVVETELGEVQVLGTSFSVKDAPGLDALEVRVATGKVRLQPGGSKQHLDLAANEAGIFQKKENKLVKIPDPTLNSISWATRRLKFVATPLQDAAQQLSQLYGVNIEVENDAVKNCPLTVTFDQKSLESALGTLEIMLGAEVEKTSDVSYLLRGGRCE